MSLVLPPSGDYLKIKKNALTSRGWEEGADRELWRGGGWEEGAGGGRWPVEAPRGMARDEGGAGDGVGCRGEWDE